MDLGTPCPCRQLWVSCLSRVCAGAEGEGCSHLRVPRPGDRWSTAAGPGPRWAEEACGPRAACCACLLLHCPRREKPLDTCSSGSGGVAQRRGAGSQCPGSSAPGRGRHYQQSSGGLPGRQPSLGAPPASAHLPRGGGQKLSSQIIWVPISLAKKNKAIRH